MLYAVQVCDHKLGCIIDYLIVSIIVYDIMYSVLIFCVLVVPLCDISDVLFINSLSYIVVETRAGQKAEAGHWQHHGCATKVIT